MDARRVRGTWSFEPDAITDESEVECRECGEWSPLAEWEEGFVECETCGDHAAMTCPKCYELYDHVWSDNDPLKIRGGGESGPEPEREPIYKLLSCLNCRGELAMLIPEWERNMIHGIGCPCGQTFMFDDRAQDHIWRGPTSGETRAPEEPKRDTSVRDAVHANR